MKKLFSLVLKLSLEIRVDSYKKKKRSAVFQAIDQSSVCFKPEEVHSEVHFKTWTKRRKIRCKEA